MAAGFPSSSSVSHDHSQHENHFPFSHLKHTLSNLFLKITKPCHLKHDHHHETTTHDDDHDHRDYHLINSASLPSVPVYIFAESAKQQLPSMSYGNFLERTSREDHEAEFDQKDSISCEVQCIVCLNQIELSHEVKAPFNCSHVFHSECLDAWVDQGQGTCPLCRSKLFQTQNHDHHDHHEFHASGSRDQIEVDPWRLERMVYLFGDDCLFGHH